VHYEVQCTLKLTGLKLDSTVRDMPGKMNGYGIMENLKYLGIEFNMKLFL
jgi:hypothetical protein